LRGRLPGLCAPRHVDVRGALSGRRLICAQWRWGNSLQTSRPSQSPPAVALALFTRKLTPRRAVLNEKAIRTVSMGYSDQHATCHALRTRREPSADLAHNDGRSARPSGPER
jgi:hypothetical protein